MPQPLGQFPRSLQAHSRWIRVGDVPCVCVHPHLDGTAPGSAWPTAPMPTILWLHGRTACKELDPGRYQRHLAAGIASIAIDLPGHGERTIESMQEPGSLADVIEQCLAEIDAVADWAQHTGFADPSAWAIGGMSAGGMVAACRLCGPHRFCALIMESSTGDLLSLPGAGDRGGLRLAALNPIDHLESWRSIPVLALHSERDRIVPIGGMRRFMEALKRRASDPSQITLHAWPSTGAPDEHAGFGRVAPEAKSMGTVFLQRVFG